MIYHNLNIILALLIAVLLNVISGWIIVSKQNRWIFLVVTIILVSIYISVEWTRSHVEKKVPVEAEPEEKKSVIISLDTSQKDLPQKPSENINIIQKEQIDTGGYTIMDSEKNSYPTFQNDNIIWLAKNLNVTVSNDEWVCYDDNPEYCTVYGKLYSLKGAQEACRTLGIGWRLPTKKEFRQLFMGNLGGFYLARGWGPERNGNPQKGYKNLIDGPLKKFNIQFGGTSNSILGFTDYMGIDSCFYYWADGTDEGFFKPFVTTLDHAIYQMYVREGGKMSCRCVIDSALFIKMVK